MMEGQLLFTILTACYLLNCPSFGQGVPIEEESDVSLEYNVFNGNKVLQDDDDERESGVGRSNKPNYPDKGLIDFLNNLELQTPKPYIRRDDDDYNTVISDPYFTKIRNLTSNRPVYNQQTSKNSKNFPNMGSPLNCGYSNVEKSIVCTTDSTQNKYDASIKLYPERNSKGSDSDSDSDTDDQRDIFGKDKSFPSGPNGNNRGKTEISTGDIFHQIIATASTILDLVHLIRTSGHKNACEEIEKYAIHIIKLAAKKCI